MFLHLMSADTKETFVFHNWQWWKGNMEEKKIQHAGNTDSNNSYIQTLLFSKPFSLPEYVFCTIPGASYEV